MMSFGAAIGSSAQDDILRPLRHRFGEVYGITIVALRHGFGLAWIAGVHCVWIEHNGFKYLGRHVKLRWHEVEQRLEVVREWKLDTHLEKHCLETFLDGLLGVKAEMLI
jgi:hypothetical protein